MYSLINDVFRFNPLRLLLTLFFMLFRSVSAGIGLLLIIPLLQTTGLSIGGPDNYSVAKYITLLFQIMHVPPTLISILISYSLVISVVALVAFAEQIISTNLQQSYIQHLREQLFKLLLNSKWLFFIKQKPAHLLQSLTTQIDAINASNFQLLVLLQHTIMISVYVTCACILSWKITLVAIICALLLLSTMLPLHRLTAIAGGHHFKKNQIIFQSISEQLNALKTIKSAGLEAKFLDETQRIAGSLEAQNQHLTYVTSIAKLTYSIGSVSIFSVLLYLSIHVFSVPLASLLLLLITFSRLLPLVSTIQQHYQRILHHLPSYCDVQQLLNISAQNQEKLNDVPSRALSFNDAIRFNNVSFSYNSHPMRPLLNLLSIQLKKNTTTVITGPSGVGKTTLMDLLIGLLEPTAGEIYIDQQPLNAQITLAWRRSVAYITQNTFLFNASIRDNLQSCCDPCSDETLWTALRSAAAADFVASFDEGLDTIIGERGVRLSGGEAQRIALARALLAKPQLLILDESTNALDKENVIKIHQALLQLRGKITIVIISHQTDMDLFADQIIALTSLGAQKVESELALSSHH